MKNLTVTFDGFRIIGANYDYLYDYDDNSGSPPPLPRYLTLGGGLNILKGKLTLNNCTFYKNASSLDGGAVYIHETAQNPEFINCTFISNFAGSGGGISNRGCSPVLENCIFLDNQATTGGGMSNMMAWYSSNSNDPVLSNCIFIENKAKTCGGGLYHQKGNFTLNKCTFTRNKAIGRIAFGIVQEPWGGGIYNHGGTLILKSCFFSCNNAYYGGAISNNGDDSTIDMTNCIITGNIANYGGGIHSFGANWIDVKNSGFIGNSGESGNAMACMSPLHKFQITNCILYDGGYEIHNPRDSKLTISFTNIKGGINAIIDPHGTITWGEGNIDVEPLFTNPGYWADTNNPNIIVEPNDPNAVWIDGDYHLKSKAGRFDPNDENWVIDNVTSPCIDAGDPNSPVGDEPEPNGGRVNMGAYGGTAEASKSVN